MRRMSVKEYARLVGKSEKTVYKKIKNTRINAVKEKGKYLIPVDKNLIKVIERTQKALEETTNLLLSIGDVSEKLKKTTFSVSNAPKPASTKKMVKNGANKAPVPLKKRPRETAAKKRGDKRAAKKQ